MFPDLCTPNSENQKTRSKKSEDFVKNQKIFSKNQTYHRNAPFNTVFCFHTLFNSCSITHNFQQSQHHTVFSTVFVFVRQLCASLCPKKIRAKKSAGLQYAPRNPVLSREKKKKCLIISYTQSVCVCSSVIMCFFMSKENPCKMYGAEGI